MLSVAVFAECHNAECRSAECHGALLIYTISRKIPFMSSLLRLEKHLRTNALAYFATNKKNVL